MVNPAASAPLSRNITRKLRMRHFEIMIEVYESRSILAASKRLNRTQPAVTKAVQDVESTLGMPLFTRTNRGLIPTTFGDSFARHAKRMLAQLRHASEELEELREGHAGHVSVGTLIAASAGLLPQAIMMLKKARPRLAITIVDGTNDLLLPTLSLGGLDMVVGRLPEHRKMDGLVQEELYFEPSCLVARSKHPLMRQRHLELKHLIDQPWILPLGGTTLRRQIEETFLNAKLPLPQNTIESMSILNNMALLRSSDCIGIMPFHVAHSEMKSGDLKILPIKLLTTTRPVGVILRDPVDLPPAANAFLECLRTVGRSLAQATRTR